MNVSEITHGSCDEFNCASAILFARTVLKLQIPHYCRDFITSEPEVAIMQKK